jgi:hypothetical protein
MSRAVMRDLGLIPAPKARVKNSGNGGPKQTDGCPGGEECPYPNTLCTECERSV